MDIQTRSIIWRIALAAVLVVGLGLRLQGIHNPILDHPGWRQGDTASIARNFAGLRYNILYPQTDYNGPPPNYVELELQIVPFLAATAYKMAGVHEIIGRLISIAFSLGTIAVLAFFGRWLFASRIAGIAAALFFTIMPGSIYYGRTFMPDTAMVFFLAAALYVTARLIVDEERWPFLRVTGAVALITLAYLAKPVAIVAIVPIAALLAGRLARGRAVPLLPAASIVFVPLILLAFYDRAVASHAEWLWASGITRKHVLPALIVSASNVSALHAKLIHFRAMLEVMAQLMLGPAMSALGVLGFLTLALPRRGDVPVRSRVLLWTWLSASLLYVYVVVTVERVDYYTYLLLPLVALAATAFVMRFAAAVRSSLLATSAKYALTACAAALLGAAAYQNHRIIRPYYQYSKQVYRNAVELDRRLAPDALVVMAHYDPSILYYIGRYGWEEDPYMWTPFDEQSAIRKGARYFITIEKDRFYRNVELCAWMQRFPVMNPKAQWPVYVTDPHALKPGAEKQWRAFRSAERLGHAREWLNAHRLCALPMAAAAANP